MGCDIHMYLEKKVGNEWVKVNKIKNAEYDEEGAKKEAAIDAIEGITRKWKSYYYKKYTDQPYHGRNYSLFAILADVRNDTGKNHTKAYTPISAPKGLPEDVSNQIKKISDSWGDDGHSHSWLTLKELKDFDWNQITTITGVVGFDEFKEHITNDKSFETWCGWAYGPQMIIISHEDALKILQHPEEDIKVNVLDWEFAGKIHIKETRSSLSLGIHKFVVPNKVPDDMDVKSSDLRVLAEWPIKYSDHTKEFIEKIIPSLEKIGKDEDIRIVFWFDN